MITAITRGLAVRQKSKAIKRKKAGTQASAEISSVSEPNVEVASNEQFSWARLARGEHCGSNPNMTAQEM